MCHVDLNCYVLPPDSFWALVMAYDFTSWVLVVVYIVLYVRYNFIQRCLQLPQHRYTRYVFVLNFCVVQKRNKNNIVQITLPGVQV